MTTWLSRLIKLLKELKASPIEELGTQRMQAKLIQVKLTKCQSWLMAIIKLKFSLKRMEVTVVSQMKMVRLVKSQNKRPKSGWIKYRIPLSKTIVIVTEELTVKKRLMNPSLGTTFHFQMRKNLRMNRKKKALRKMKMREIGTFSEMRTMALCKPMSCLWLCNREKRQNVKIELRLSSKISNKFKTEFLHVNLKVSRLVVRRLSSRNK